MSGYPVIYWVVVAIVAGAVSAVLMGIGYLFGIQQAARRVAALRDELARDQVEWRNAPLAGLSRRYDDLSTMARTQGGL